jgi:uncharacterized protein
MEEPMSNAPWYRHRWPWLLMMGPAVVVAAGLATWVLAARVAANDGLVTEPHGASEATATRNGSTP